MTDAQVTWREGLAFTGSAPSGFSIPLSSDDDGLSPMELMALSLAGCTGMDVISILQKKRQDVLAFEVRVHADRQAEHPKVFTATQIYYLVTGHAVSEDALLRAIELSATKYCPAYAMLAATVPIQMHYEIYEAGASGKPSLTKSGEWHVPRS